MGIVPSTPIEAAAICFGGATGILIIEFRSTKAGSLPHQSELLTPILLPLGLLVAVQHPGFAQLVHSGAILLAYATPLGLVLVMLLVLIRGDVYGSI